MSSLNTTGNRREEKNIIQDTRESEKPNLEKVETIEKKVGTEVREDLKLSQYTQEHIEAHVRNSTYDIKPEDKKKSQCIDGRYGRSDNAAVAIPGGDAGQLEVMIAAVKASNKKRELNRRQLKKLAKILIETVGSEKDLSFHTDEHHHKHGIGCGHLHKGTNHPEHYGLTPREMRFIMKFMNANVKKGAKNIVLKGEHEEKAVAIVYGKSKSIHNKDAMGNQIFVFNRTMVDERNALIAKKIQESGITKDDISNTMNDATTKHLFTTAQKIAPGKPIFDVNLDEEKPKITSQGIVKREEKEKNAKGRWGGSERGGKGRWGGSAKQVDPKLN